MILEVETNHHRALTYLVLCISALSLLVIIAPALIFPLTGMLRTSRPGKITLHKSLIPASCARTNTIILRSTREYSISRPSERSHTDANTCLMSN